jgi:uncharacterized RDD family membrane protein YckC
MSQSTSDLQLYADQLNIETPEQVDLRFPIAGIGSRFLAVLLDTLLQFLIQVIFYVLLYVTDSYKGIDSVMTKQSGTTTRWLVAAFIFLNFIFYWGYFVLFEAFYKGQTPGKRVMKLRVMKDTGRAITLFESMTRNLVRIVDAFPGMYVVGLIAMASNRSNKRLGDFAAGTLVVHESLEDQPLLSHTSRTFTTDLQRDPATAAQRMPNAQKEWEAGEAVLPADAVAKLGTSDLHLIETFFHRALDLSIEKREQLGTRLAQQMSAKMGVPLPAGMAPERLLELIANKMRSHG